MEIAYSVIELLSEGQVVLYYARYKQLKEAKKRLFGGWKAAEFSTKDGSSKLKQQLIDNGWQDGTFADYQSCGFKKLWLPGRYRIDWKHLCILQEKLDMTLLRQTDFTYSSQGSDCSGVNITVFPETVIQKMQNNEAAITRYMETDDYILSICADILLSRAYITLNPKYMSVEDLIEKLKLVTDKYHKKLEVLL